MSLLVIRLHNNSGAQGKSPEEIKSFVADAFAKGVFQPPTRPGIDYMLSTENLTPDGKGGVSPFPPHVMFYGPYLTNTDIGSDGNPGGPVPSGRIPGPGHAPSEKPSGSQ